MPSTLIGTISGGAQLYSGGFGSPWSGMINQPRGLVLYLSPVQSGAVFVGFSGAVTVTSGGVLGAGGEADGFPLFAGERMSITLPAGGVEALRIGTPAANSGVRLFWDDSGNFGI